LACPLESAGHDFLAFSPTCERRHSLQTNKRALYPRTLWAERLCTAA
jgi:hypothetical protein